MRMRGITQLIFYLINFSKEEFYLHRKYTDTIKRTTCEIIIRSSFSRNPVSAPGLARLCCVEGCYSLTYRPGSVINMPYDNIPGAIGFLQHTSPIVN